MGAVVVWLGKHVLLPMGYQLPVSSSSNLLRPVHHLLGFLLLLMYFVISVFHACYDGWLLAVNLICAAQIVVRILIEVKRHKESAGMVPWENRLIWYLGCSGVLAFASLVIALNGGNGADALSAAQIPISLAGPLISLLDGTLDLLVSTLGAVDG